MQQKQDVTFYFMLIYLLCESPDHKKPTSSCSTQLQECICYEFRVAVHTSFTVARSAFVRFTGGKRKCNFDISVTVHHIYK